MVQKNSVILEYGEVDANVLVVLLVGSARLGCLLYMQIRIDVFGNIVHETLERLGGVSQAK
jgi:hypothetical protein